jgi:hypothetical protein
MMHWCPQCDDVLLPKGVACKKCQPPEIDQDNNRESDGGMMTTQHAPDSRNPDVITMIEDRLKADGFDGLYNSDAECACQIGNLGLCSGFQRDCEGGYLQDCPETCGDHDWHIGPDKAQGVV